MVYVASCGKPFDLDIDGRQHEERCSDCFAAKHPKLVRTIASLVTDDGVVDIDAILSGQAFANFTPRDWIDLALAAIDQAVPIGEVGKAVEIIERYRDDY